MKMNKMFTGLIALVAGVALSAGSAFATNGYVGGDFARMKLVPYYETADSRATIIGIQNLSPQEADTMARNQRVTDLQAYLAGEDPSTQLAADAVTGGDLEDLAAIVTVDGAPTALNMDSLDSVAAVEAALETAMMAVQTEHLFVAVNVYDAMGMMMENASTELCLKEHQFGVIVLQGPSATMAEGYQMQVLSMMDGDIPAYGYVEIAADTTKYSACGSESFRDPVATIVTADADNVVDTVDPAQSMVAAWTIIQDIGDGFFGTEVPTSTISMESNVGMEVADAEDDGDPELACYTAASPNGQTVVAAADQTANTTGVFMQSRCGLIPERHQILTDDAGVLVTVGQDNVVDSSTPNTNAIARYDAGDESMVYVWLAKGMDTENTHASMARMLDVIVKCEDGTVMTGMDQYGDPTDAIAVAAPGMLTMIDPNMGDLGEAVGMCEGDRGVLRITMPDGSHAGAVFSHVTQMGGHYRMNFPGYSMASPTEIDATAAQ